MKQSTIPFDFKPYRNSGLFADHFLEDPSRLHAMPEWADVSGMEEAFNRIAQLHAQYAQHFVKQTNEAQTEDDFIKPILNIFWEQDEGKCWQTQVSIPNVDERRQPDYAFFRMAADRNAAEPRKGTIEYWHDVPVLGDAKAWTDSLDKQRGYDENPSAQICKYLYRSRVRWGILTNGRIWRLYEREKSSAGGIFFEVNLEDLLSTINLENFKYFYLFFRRKAFLPDANGESFIEKVFIGSTKYAINVGDRLKESVYDALRHLMNGFLDFTANNLNRNDPQTLELVHTNSLIVLYRLLFLLYAEDRDLLPCDNEHYRDHSMQRLHQQINTYSRNHHQYLRQSNEIWSKLLNLFHLIDEGVIEAGIPAYNGGLFSPEKHPNISHSVQAGFTRWEVGDLWIAQVVDMLAYKREQWNQPGTEDIDYNTLGVQHLGSIYEGLLELKPSIAEEDLVEVLDDGKPVYKPVREVPNPRTVHRQEPRRITAEEVYLVTNRGERKASGSYYTPKYIVDYIVENTVEPLINDAAKRVAELLSEVKAEISKLTETMKSWENQRSPNVSQRDSFKKQIESQKRRLLEPYLNLKILDPAMGSGHFLVGAADFISLAIATDPNILPLESMGEEEPQSYYKRLVVERCLYGVDFNPLAVELAKLSLWLHTVSKDKALSFLDHHLRCGNSLIGARTDVDLKREPPVLNARGKWVNKDNPQQIIGFNETLQNKHLNPILALLRQIAEIPTQNVTTEKQKEELWNQLEAIRPKYRAVANCWLAPFFDQPFSAGQYQQAVNALHNEQDWRKLEAQPRFRAAQVVAEENRFFHWELEFPEIFFNPTGLKPRAQRGFDAVVGNPPYERTALFVSEGNFLGQRFETAYGSYDLYVLFMENSLDILNDCGRFGYITSNKFLVADYGEKLRDKIHSQHSIEQIIDLTECPSVFPEVLISSAVSIIRKGLISGNETLIVIFKRDDLSLVSKISADNLQENEDVLGFIASRRKQSDLRDELTGHFAIYLAGKVKILNDKLYIYSDLLKNVAEIRTGIMGFQYWSLEPIISDGMNNEGLTIPILPPSLVDRYSILWGHDYVDL